MTAFIILEELRRQREAKEKANADYYKRKPRQVVTFWPCMKDSTVNCFDQNCETWCYGERGQAIPIEMITQNTRKRENNTDE